MSTDDESLDSEEGRNLEEKISDSNIEGAVEGPRDRG